MPAFADKPPQPLSLQTAALQQARATLIPSLLICFFFPLLQHGLQGTSTDLWEEGTPTGNQVRNQGARKWQGGDAESRQTSPTSYWGRGKLFFSPFYSALGLQYLGQLYGARGGPCSQHQTLSHDPREDAWGLVPISSRGSAFPRHPPLCRQQSAPHFCAVINTKRFSFGVNTSQTPEAKPLGHKKKNVRNVGCADSWVTACFFVTKRNFYIPEEPEMPVWICSLFGIILSYDVS